MNWKKHFEGIPFVGQILSIREDKYEVLDVNENRKLVKIKDIRTNTVHNDISPNIFDQYKKKVD